MQEDLKAIIRQSLIEDRAFDDTTSDLLIKENSLINFIISPRERLIFCGYDVINEVFNQLQASSKFSKCKLNIDYLAKDGDKLNPNQLIAKGIGDAKLIFAAERLILNLIQHLSSIATNTRNLVEKLNNPKIKILDTRKTIPLLRILQKYAVKVGGGENHRFHLADLILIKDNHIAAAGGVKNALILAKLGSKPLKIEIECDHIGQVQESLKYNPDIIMLDNMKRSELEQSIKLIRIESKSKIEVSGNISADNIDNYQNLDIDYISIGGLTNSIKIVDIGLDISKD